MSTDTLPHTMTISVDLDPTRVVAAAVLMPLGVRPKVTYAELLRLCAENELADVEWDPDGTLYVISLRSAAQSHKNVLLTARLGSWANSESAGLVFGSSTGFLLADGKMRSPDAAWIRNERWQALTKSQQVTFAPIAPDFLAELRSPTDNLNDLRAKMDLYRHNGVRLGWLIDPIDHAVEIYRPGHLPQRLDNPRSVDGGDVLPGFVLDLKGILFD